jgi:hypothetical protein
MTATDEPDISTKTAGDGDETKRERSQLPSDSLVNQLGSSSCFSPSKRGNHSPRSNHTALTQSISSSRSYATRSKALELTSEGQRKKSQDSMKLLVTSIDMDFADGFKICENSASSAVRKSEKARQARLLASVEPTDSIESDEKEIASRPKRERKPSVDAGCTSRTMAIRSSVWPNAASPANVAASEAPEMPEGLDPHKQGDGRKMSRRTSNSAVAAASTVLARPVVSSSSQPGGRVRRMSLRASGQGEEDKKESTI